MEGVNIRNLFGKYRGTVKDNNDPNRQGRIEVEVPSVFGEGGSAWAMPCVPYAGNGLGFLALPEIDADVWVEFMDGDSECPIWVGCFWRDRGTTPLDPYNPEKKILKTNIGAITLDDNSGSGGIIIETADGMKIEIKSSGIEITNGQAKIKMEGRSVSINDGALEIT